MRSIRFVGHFVYPCDVNAIKERTRINSMRTPWNALSGSFNRQLPIYTYTSLVIRKIFLRWILHKSQRKFILIFNFFFTILKLYVFYIFILKTIDELTYTTLHLIALEALKKALKRTTKYLRYLLDVYSLCNVKCSKAKMWPINNL